MGPALCVCHRRPSCRLGLLYLLAERRGHGPSLVRLVRLVLRSYRDRRNDPLVLFLYSHDWKNTCLPHSLDESCDEQATLSAVVYRDRDLRDRDLRDLGLDVHLAAFC